MKRLAIAYVAIGFSISLWQSMFGELSAFLWTGSIKGNLLLLLWWFIIPGFIWPWDLFWGLFHRIF